MKENNPSFLCLELAGNVTINNQIHSYKEDIPEKFVMERIAHYRDRDYSYPDNSLIVLYYPNGDLIPRRSDFDFFSYLNTHWQTMKNGYDISAKVDARLQLAACCVDENLKPTPANMGTLYGTSRFEEFCKRQQKEIGILRKFQVKELATEQRHDDWSFVFGMTDRRFSENEQKDILAFGCILFSLIEEELRTKDNIPSFDDLKSLFGGLSLLLSDKYATGIMDVPIQIELIKRATETLLSKKYPEVANVIIDLCGRSSGNAGNEVYAMVDLSGKPIHVGTNQDLGYDFRSFSNYYSNTETIEEQNAKDYKIIRIDKTNVEDYKFIRYRFEDKSLIPPMGDDKVQFWKEVTAVARETGIMPKDVLSIYDSSYCYRNSRSPMHPDNIHGKLIHEKSYLEHCRKLKGPVVQQNEKRHDIPEQKMQQGSHPSKQQVLGKKGEIEL